MAGPQTRSWALAPAPLWAPCASSPLHERRRPLERRATAKATKATRSTKATFLTHLAVLVKLFWSKLDRSTSTSTAAPVPRRSRRAFRRDFRRRGCGVVQIPEKRISGLRSVAAQYLRKELETPGSLPLPPTSLFETDLDDEDEDERKRKEGEGSFRRAGGLNVAFPQSMSWHWATDRNTLEAFPAEEVLRSLPEHFALVAASLVVANGDCSEEAAKFHLDFGPPKIPRSATATALLPLFPSQFPHEGHLEVQPWDANEMVTHRYETGKAIVFDGKLSHRTQPFHIQSFSRGGAPPVRVLASMSFALLPSHAPWRNAVKQAPSFCEEQRRIEDVSKDLEAEQEVAKLLKMYEDVPIKSP